MEVSKLHVVGGRSLEEYRVFPVKLLLKKLVQYYIKKNCGYILQTV